MKLTPEQIAKIEELLTDIDQGYGYRSVVIKYGFRDIGAATGLTSCFRALGIDVRSRSAQGGVVLRGKELSSYKTWLAEQKAARQRKGDE